MHYSRIHRPSRLPNFEQAVWALTDATISDRKTLAGNTDLTGETARFVLDVHAKMPDFLRLAIRVLTLLFDAWPYATAGRPFHALDLPQRLSRMHTWEHSRLDARRGLITFYKSFAIYGLYSELYGSEKQSGPRG